MRWFRTWRKNGLTSQTAQLLSADYLPSYLELGEKYKVVNGPRLLYIAPVGDEIHLYRVQSVNDVKAPIYYVSSPHLLPPEFWIRKLVARSAYYEILEGSDEGWPKQVIEARARESMPAAA